MAFTVTFPTAAAAPSIPALSSWLVEHGEPFEEEGASVVLKALPLRLVRDENGITAWIEVNETTPLPRLVELIFDLSVRLGSDVKLAGAGPVDRPGLWLVLADEQDRQRLAAALEQSAQRGNKDDVDQRMWALLQAIHPGRDLRWDAQKKRVVELLEVGSGIERDEARWLDESAGTGEIVVKAIEGPVHVLLWRFVAQAWPGLAEWEE
jgi:hypothetical protein